jgi:hypothetical protein
VLQIFGLQIFAESAQYGMASLGALVRYADELLQLSEIRDFPHALNGLQIENSGEVSRIGAAVDASRR